MAASDIRRARHFTGAIHGIVDVTPSDATELVNGDGANPTNLLIAEEGAIAIEDVFGNQITFASGGLAVGVFHRLKIRKVLDTGTGIATSGAIKVGWDG